MRVLALDTATAATVAAVVDTVTGMSLEARDDPPPGARPGHAATLLRLVEGVLQRSGDGWAGIDRIAVGLGPGTFTGLRIGIATAQGLARARAKPLVGVSTLASLAAGARGARGLDAGETVLAVIDARRGEAFAGAYAAEPHLMPSVLSPAALAAATARETVTATRVMAVGDGAIKFRDILESAGAAVPEDASDLHRVSALWHVGLAEVAEPRPLSAIQPEYLRDPDAQLKQ